MLTNAFRSLDLFEFEGRPRHIEGPLRSRFGFVGSIVLLSIMIFYVVFSTYNFLTEPPQTSVAQSPTSSGPQQMVKTCVRLPNITDKRFFGYTFQRIHNNENSVATEKVDLKVVEDNVTSEVCLAADSANGYLSNFCKLGQECDYLKFKLWLCGTPDAKNPAFWNDSAKCQPFRDLVKVTQNNYVDFIYYTQIGAVIFHTAPKVNASAQYFSIFQVNETRRSSDLLRWWVEESQFQLQHQRDTFAIQYYFGPVPDKEILELQIVMGSEALLTFASHKTSLDLVGSFGALYGVIFSALAFIFMRYNEKKFYVKNPAWEKIDPAFRVEPGSEVSGESIFDQVSESLVRIK
jgi:hypothetical protein